MTDIRESLFFEPSLPAFDGKKHILAQRLKQRWQRCHAAASRRTPSQLSSISWAACQSSQSSSSRITAWPRACRWLGSSGLASSRAACSCRYSPNRSIGDKDVSSNQWLDRQRKARSHFQHPSPSFASTITILPPAHPGVNWLWPGVETSAGRWCAGAAPCCGSRTTPCALPSPDTSAETPRPPPPAPRLPTGSFDRLRTGLRLQVRGYRECQAHAPEASRWNSV